MLESAPSVPKARPSMTPAPQRLPKGCLRDAAGWARTSGWRLVWRELDFRSEQGSRGAAGRMDAKLVVVMATFTADLTACGT